MRIAFNNMNKSRVPSARAVVTNAGQECWRTLGAVRRITGGMDTGFAELKRSNAMKTLIRAARKPQRSFVPITPFEFESFEVCVRRVTRRGPLPIGAAFRRVNINHHSRRFKTIPRPIYAAQRAKNLLPSPLLQGHGLMCLRSGARPVARPVALSSRQWHASAPDPIPKAAREPARISCWSRWSEWIDCEEVKL